MRVFALIIMLLFYSPFVPLGQRLAPPRNSQSTDDDDDEEMRQALIKNDEENDVNATALPLEQGMFLGAACVDSCSPKLLHVQCNPDSGLCECEKSYPVKLDPYTGCAKPKRLGDQCYYRETCKHSDQHSACVQVDHNAVCQCEGGYHLVSVQKPSKRVFCAEDLDLMTTNDFATFAGVLSGIALLSGLLCFVLRLFNQNLYGTRRHRFGNANLAPPILFSSDPGSLPMPIYDRSLTSRTSSRRTIASLPSRRASSAQGCRGISASRAGSRRPSLTSVHSLNSLKSYSARRYEREREQKEEREMQRRLARMTSSANSSGRVAPTPSPHSTDDLLPTLEEDKQKESSWIAIVPPLAIQEESSSSFNEEMPSTSKQYP